MPRRPRVIRSWLDLARLAEDSAADDWIFRGESHASEALRPSAGRPPQGPRTPRRLRFGIDDERAALENAVVFHGHRRSLKTTT